MMNSKPEYGRFDHFVALGAQGSAADVDFLMDRPGDL